MERGKDMNRANNIYIVGSWIASLAAAVYLIRHNIVPPERVTIFESGDHLGGAMEALTVDVPPSSDYPGRPKEAYVLPATRLLDEHYACALGLLKNFPCVSDTSKTIAQDIINFNRDSPYDDKARILNSARKVVNGRQIGAFIRKPFQFGYLVRTLRGVLSSNFTA